jgi:ribonuclease HI
MTRATVITDASFCSETRSGGWAAWIAYDGGGPKGQHAGMFRNRPLNSGVAELQAALNGIWLAYQNGARDILIQTDCLAIVHAAQGKGAYGKTFMLEKRTHFSQAVIRAKHVKGHSTTQDARSWCNRWADKQAKLYMRKQRDGETT